MAWNERSASKADWNEGHARPASRLAGVLLRRLGGLARPLAALHRLTGRGRLVGVLDLRFVRRDPLSRGGLLLNETSLCLVLLVCLVEVLRLNLEALLGLVGGVGVGARVGRERVGGLGLAPVEGGLRCVLVVAGGLFLGLRLELGRLGTQLRRAVGEVLRLLQFVVALGSLPARLGLGVLGRCVVVLRDLHRVVGAELGQP